MENLERQLQYYCENGDLERLLHQINEEVSLPSDSKALPLAKRLVSAVEKDIEPDEVKDEILSFLDHLWKSSDEVPVSYRLMVTKNYQLHQVCYCLALLYFAHSYYGSEDMEEVINCISEIAESVIENSDSLYESMLRNGTLPTVEQAKERDILSNLQWQTAICMMYEGRWYSDIGEQIHRYLTNEFLDAVVYAVDSFCVPLARSIEDIH